MNGDVHVLMTREALARAGALEAAPDDGWEHVRGVLWNDDPEGYVERGEGGDVLARLFEAQAAGAVFGPGDSLFGRGHFGDLQFLHAMACVEHEPADVTLSGMLAWAELVHGVATGATAADVPLAQVPVPAMAERFAHGPDLTLSGLLQASDAAALRARATGSLLHVVQDSFASAHVERVELGAARRGPILRFLWYGGQDPVLHAAADAFPGESALDQLHTVGGALDGLDQSARVLELLASDAAWEPVERLLREEVFALAEGVQAAAPGAAFARSVPA
jgi:hypothetical protein